MPQKSHKKKESPALKDLMVKMAEEKPEESVIVQPVAPAVAPALDEQPELPPPAVPKKFPVPPFLLQATAGVVIILLLGVSIYFYHAYQTAKNSATSPQAESQLIQQVGNLIELPSETPTIATVSDVSKLSGQPFFTHAQNGDKVLIYQQAKEAILYRPSENKLIQVGSLNIGNQTAQSNAQVAGASTTASPTPTVTPTHITVEVYNGTKTPGLAASAAKKITQAYPTDTIAGTGNSQNDYTETIVVDLSGKNGAAATQIAKTVNGTVSTLPSGEKQPSADILVILGTDYQ